jgi:hypothetical protein
VISRVDELASVDVAVGHAAQIRYNRYRIGVLGNLGEHVGNQSGAGVLHRLDDVLRVGGSALHRPGQAELD